MGLQEAQIELDNAWATYYPGQTVNGKVHFTFDSPKKVRGIFVQFKGEAQTSWSEKTSQRDAQGQTQQVELPHSGKEEYFQMSYYLLGSKTGNEIELPVGSQSFNFTATLPPTLPSSFEGEYGYVRYTVTVTLDRPWKYDQETKMAFTVISPLDLNLNPSYREPIRMQLEKTFCCFCCASAPLAVDVRAPVTGYVPGQSIPVQLSVDNQSNVQLHLVKLQLRKVVTFRTTLPTPSTKKSKVTVVEVSEGPVPASQTREWNLKLDIPPLPPSNLVGCGLIDLDYDFKVECSVSGLHMSLSDKAYVTIGTVPLVGGAPTGPTSGVPTPLPGGLPPPATGGAPQPAPVAPGFQPQPPSAPYMDDPNNRGMGVGAGGEGNAAGGWPVPQQPPHQSLYPSLSSPMYQESQFNARNIQDNQHMRITGRQDFAPRYPTYNIPLPQ